MYNLHSWEKPGCSGQKACDGHPVIVQWDLPSCFFFFNIRDTDHVLKSVSFSRLHLITVDSESFEGPVKTLNSSHSTNGCPVLCFYRAAVKQLDPLNVASVGQPLGNVGVFISPL